LESQVNVGANLRRRWSVFGLSCSLLGAIGWGHAQEQSKASGGTTEMSLRKSVITRQFQGREFAGEEREIARGESLWRILVEEKRLPDRRFHSYLIIIRGLNPQIKSLDVLRVGDRLFIPLRLDDAGQAASSTTAAAAGRRQATDGRTVNYRVKEGDHLYRILREQLKLSDQRKLAEYYALVTDLNPGRENWDNLLEGELIRLPVIEPNVEIAKAETIAIEPGGGTAKAATGVAGGQPRGSLRALPSSSGVTSETAETASKSQVAPALSPTAEQAIRSPARENMQLFVRVAEALGSEVQQSGEEVVALADGAVRLDRSSYPVIYHAALRQRVVIDPDGNIPTSLKSKLGDPSIGAPILAMTSALSLDDAVRQLLVGLGYQPLPAEKPIIVQNAGVAVEAKGNWMALAPDVSNKTQEVLVINLTDATNKIPDYLKSALAKQGLDLREIILRQPVNEPGMTKISKELKTEPTAARNLPLDKREIVDAILLSFGVAFGVAEDISVELRDGLRIDKRADRIFELNSKRTALFFKPLDATVRRALQERHGILTVEIAIDALSTRDVIARVLHLLDDQAVYREHRFPAAPGSVPDRLTVKAWGFHVAQKAMFVTDRQIPPALHRFFFEKGLEIVYFH